METPLDTTRHHLRTLLYNFRDPRQLPLHSYRLTVLVQYGLAAISSSFFALNNTLARDPCADATELLRIYYTL